MSMDVTSIVLLPNFNTWARPVTITPRKSSAAGPAYTARGIWHKNTMDVMTQDGVVFSDHKQTLSIRDAEFAITPLKGDVIDIPADATHAALGAFEVTDVDHDGEGGTELTLRQIMPAKP